MAYADTLPPQRRFGQTTRPDAWWVQPLFVFLGFSAFIVYSTWAAFQGIGDIHNHACSYWYGGNGANYLSPFYSPEMWGTSPHAVFGAALPSWWPGWAPFSPAFLILWAPAGFRFTCYYYRGAYYKAFWADPINCAVGEPRKTFLGERSFPLILQNIHRYMFYLAALFIVILSYDAWLGMWFTDSTGTEHFGIGVGTIVLMLQREVADRIATAPGKSEYGLLSATTQLYARVEKLFTLPAGAFSPPPKVQSTAVRLTMVERLEKLHVPETEFVDFIKLAFGQKRKTLWNNLKERYKQGDLRAALEQSGIKPNVRAEALTLEDTAKLFRGLPATR